MATGSTTIIRLIMACQLKTMNKIAYKEERKVIKELNEIEGNPQGEE